MISEDIDRTKEILSYFVQPGDLIYIPKQTNYIEILGSVQFPGRYPFYKDLEINDYIKSAGGKTNNATNNLYIIDNASNQRNKVRGSSKLENGDILFVQSKEDYSPYNRFKEVMFILGQAASLYAVIMINNNTVSRNSFMLVISSPSGAGKTALANKLLNVDNGFALSVSVSTRPPRPGEIDGKDYYFVDESEFKRQIKRK